MSLKRTRILTLSCTAIAIAILVSLWIRQVAAKRTLSTMLSLTAALERRDFDAARGLCVAEAYWTNQFSRSSAGPTDADLSDISDLVIRKINKRERVRITHNIWGDKRGVALFPSAYGSWPSYLGTYFVLVWQGGAWKFTGYWGSVQD